MIQESLLRKFTERALELEPDLFKDESARAFIEKTLTDATQRIQVYLSNRETQEKSIAALTTLLAKALANERNHYIESIGRDFVTDVVTKAFKEEPTLPLAFNDSGRLVIQLKVKGDFQMSASLEAVIRRSLESLSIERLNAIESSLIDALKQIGEYRLVTK